MVKKKNVKPPKTEEEIIKSEEELINAVLEDNKEEDNKEDKEEPKEEPKEELKNVPKEEPELELTLDIPPIVTIKEKPKKKEKPNIDYKTYFFDEETKKFVCKKCMKEYKTEGTCISHIKKIHYHGKDISLDKLKGGKYKPIWTVREFKKNGKDISIYVMMMLTYNGPLTLKNLLAREQLRLINESEKEKIILFAQKTGEQNQKRLEKSWHLWYKDFYTLLCKIRIFNLIFKIKYLALLSTFLSCSKQSYQDYSIRLEGIIEKYR